MGQPIIHDYRVRMTTEDARSTEYVRYQGAEGANTRGSCSIACALDDILVDLSEAQSTPKIKMEHAAAAHQSSNTTHSTYPLELTNRPAVSVSLVQPVTTHWSGLRARSLRPHPKKYPCALFVAEAEGF